MLSQSPSPLEFWYRQSGDALTGMMFHTDLLTPGIVDRQDPPPINSGMSQVELDHRGRLTFFETIPPQRQRRAHARSGGGLDTALCAGRSGSDEVSAVGAALELARRRRYACGMDRHVAGKRPAAARRGRRAWREAGRVHAGGPVAKAVADAAGVANARQRNRRRCFSRWRSGLSRVPGCWRGRTCGPAAATGRARRVWPRA